MNRLKTWLCTERAGQSNLAFTTTHSDSLQLTPTHSDSPRLYHDSPRIWSPEFKFRPNIAKIGFFDNYLTLYWIEERFDTKIQRFRYETINIFYIAIFSPRLAPNLIPIVFFVSKSIYFRLKPFSIKREVWWRSKHPLLHILGITLNSRDRIRVESW